MLFQELGKLKRSSIMTSIITMAVGVLMIMCPAQYVGALVSTLGYVMVIFSSIWVLNFISGKRVLMNYIYLTGALIVALLGIAVLVMDNIVGVIGLIFGLVAIADGAITIFHAYTYFRRAEREGWQTMIVLGGLLVLFGLIVLINPWWSEPTKLFDVIGGMLLFASVVSIVRLVFIWPIKAE